MNNYPTKGNAYQQSLTVISRFRNIIQQDIVDEAIGYAMDIEEVGRRVFYAALKSPTVLRAMDKGEYHA